MARREFTRNQKEQIVERAYRSKSKCIKWIEDLISSQWGDACIEWPFSKRETGYGQVFYHGRRTSSNNLICEIYRGPSGIEGAHAAHECGNRSCCNPDHIVWKTPAENCADKEEHGTQLRGSRIYNAKISERDVVEIRRLCSLGLTMRVVAERFGICPQNVCDIKNHKTWRHV